MPSERHHADSELSPQIPRVANGGPLSLRMASGSPYLSKANSMHLRDVSPLIEGNPVQHRIILLKLSVIVSG
ncbi:MAG: hypothetical protein ACJAYU_004181 [Bradymonadia bacterium]|jgi:hypothetical protein